MYGIFSNISSWAYNRSGTEVRIKAPGVIYKQIPPNIFEYKPPPLYLNSEHTSTMDGNIRPSLVSPN